MHEARRYVVWGSAGHAMVLNEAIRRCGGKVIALFDNAPNAKSVILGVPLIGGEGAFPDWAERLEPDHGLSGLIAIGGARGKDRLSLQRLLGERGIQFDSLVHPLAFVADDVNVGDGTQVLAMAVVGAGARLGAACIVNHKASVDHECQVADGVHVAPGATLCGCVTVHEHAMIGAGSVVLPYLTIGRGSIVGAGAVVTADVPDGAVVAGNPAKPLRC